MQIDKQLLEVAPGKNYEVKYRNRTGLVAIFEVDGTEFLQENEYLEYIDAETFGHMLLQKYEGCLPSEVEIRCVQDDAVAIYDIEIQLKKKEYGKRT